jgi:hypothetical protein
VLQPGDQQSLGVTFSPADTANYLPVSATTKIDIKPSGAAGANIVVTRTLRRTGDTISIDLVLANAGGTAAVDAVLHAVKIGSTSAAGLPLNLGTIAPGEVRVVTVQVAGSAGNPGAAGNLTVSGSFAGGSFSSAARVTLP